MTGAEGRGCARCKRQPAHAVVHTARCRHAQARDMRRWLLCREGGLRQTGPRQAKEGGGAALCRREGPNPGGDLHRPTTGVS